MKLHEMNQKIYDLQEDIEDFMEELSGEPYECTIVVEGDTIRIKLEGEMEFLEIVMDEFENFYVEVATATFKYQYQEEILEYLEELEF
jgi:DNA-binding protein YbaB